MQMENNLTRYQLSTISALIASWIE